MSLHCCVAASEQTRTDGLQGTGFTTSSDRNNVNLSTAGFGLRTKSCQTIKDAQAGYEAGLKELHKCCEQLDAKLRELAILDIEQKSPQTANCGSKDKSKPLTPICIVNSTEQLEGATHAMRSDQERGGLE